MPEIKIDNRSVTVEDGATILEAARKLGIEIPTLCNYDKIEPCTTCMVCVVKVEGYARLLPSCSTKAIDGMNVTSESDEVFAARKLALELLLGDHLGDCEAPCQSVCPASLNIPKMLRETGAGEIDKAIMTIRDSLPLAAILGRVCPAPCEKACRRKEQDSPINIRAIHGAAAEEDMKGAAHTPEMKPSSGKRVAIIGAGAAGLSSAYYLLREGHACHVFDSEKEPGGQLRKLDKLPREILSDEAALIFKMGVNFHPGVKVGNEPTLAALRGEFDAVVIASGNPELYPDNPLTGSIPVSDSAGAPQTSVDGLFIVGDASRPRRMVVQSIADAQKAAFLVSQYLAGKETTLPEKRLTTRVGKLAEGEIGEYMKLASGENQFSESDIRDNESARRKEAARCLHCDCRKAESCRLRSHSEKYGASPSKHKTGRRELEIICAHPEIIYEPGKCINCKTCITIAENAGEDLGLTQLGRGFEVRTAVPFGKPLSDALTKVADECVRACPTGALAFRD